MTLQQRQDLHQVDKVVEMRYASQKNAIIHNVDTCIVKETSKETQKVISSTSNIECADIGLNIPKLGGF